MKMASLKDISERYKRVCESFIKKTVKTGLKDKGDSVFKLPENYIEIALMKIIESRGIEEVDIDYSEILQENPIDKSKWVPTLVYIDTDDTLGVRWDKFLAYNTECGCIDVYEDTDSYESFSEQDEYVQKELYREVMNALGMEYVEPETMYYQTLESFVGHVSRKRNTDLIPDAIYPDGVYILHETLGVRTVDGWNPKNNNGVVGILLVEDDHKIVVATEDAPENLTWSEKRGLINQPIEELEDAESDFNGEMYCRKLDSPDFPAAYYCKTYNKGGRSWYLPSSGELWLICNHFKEIQKALSIVGGQKFATNWDKDVPEYLSSTESNPGAVWAMDFSDDYLDWYNKVSEKGKVRPVSNFSQNRNLKESFTKKTTTKGRNEIIGQSDNLVVDYENLIKGLIKKYGFSTIHKYFLSLIRGVGYKEPPYVRRHEPFTEDKMVTILGELEFDKSETSDNGIKVIWRKTKKFYYRSPIEKTEKFSELSVDEKRDIYEYLINWLNVRIDEDEKIEKMDKLPQSSRNVV